MDRFWDELGGGPESGGSLDLVWGRRQARLGRPTVKVRRSSDTGSEILRDAEEFEGDEAVDQRIQRWRRFVRDYAVGSGFRKAGRVLDPRRLARRLAQLARRQAVQTGSRVLGRLARRLAWAARQRPAVAARELRRWADTSAAEGDDGPPGRPVIQRPGLGVPEGQGGPPRSQRPPGGVVDAEERETGPGPGGVAPGPRTDRSWAAERAGTRRQAEGPDQVDVDYKLVAKARDFLQDYQSTNSLGSDLDTDMLDQPEVFDAWLVDLDAKGEDADPADLDAAWQQALQEITGTEPEDDFDFFGDADDDDLGLQASRKYHLSPLVDIAPGGDYFNTVVHTEESPALDHYLQKISSRVGKRRSGVTQAVDQCLDHFAGEMLPGEISPEDVQQFVRREFPHLSWKQVYQAVQKLADPRRRHDPDDDDDRDDERRTNTSSRKRTSRVRKKK